MENSGYGFEQFERELNISNILNNVSELILWRYYLGVDFSLNKDMSAPYRKDKTPSLRLGYSPKGRIIYKDFGAGEYGDIFNFVGERFGLSFIEVLQKINTDFGLGLGSGQVINQAVKKKEQKALIKFEKEFSHEPANTVPFHIVQRYWNQQDRDFWTNFGLTKAILVQYNVYPVEKLFIKNYLVYTYDPQKPAYAYYFPETGHMKVYFPYGDQSGTKFRGNVNNFEDVQGYYQCDVKRKDPEKLLILTKSMKDCMVLRRLGYDAMAINGEGHYYHKDFIRHIKKYYPRIISLYDPDRAGIKGAKFLWKEYGIVPYFIPKRYRASCKDIADISALFGLEKAEETMKEILGHFKSLAHTF